MTKNFMVVVILIVLFGCNRTALIKVIEKPVPIQNNTNRDWNEGWISVAENRMEPSSNLIELPFVLSKVPDSIPNSNIPVLIMSGGPGNTSLHMANGVVNTPWGKNRDIIVLEQRGTVHAKPSLKCPEIDSLRILGDK